ncbi:TfoX/Sxy family protein [Streptomyces sp. NPDC001796]|uniref:TfoX/Sxy family protein n=1 Tax=Streptomyces sp. NPDC001796 TaxID=3364609 RepID=UPI0036B3A548
MAYDKDLADRIREALAGEARVREVRMFGGLTFMVNDKMTATANTHGQLMVRCDPDRVEELLERDGADWPEMRGRRMSKGWIVVDAYGTESEEAFNSWIEEALSYNRKANGGDD